MEESVVTATIPNFSMRLSLLRVRPSSCSASRLKCVSAMRRMRMFSFLSCRRDGYHVTLVRDAAAAFSIDRIHAAHELNGPNFAHAILTTPEVVDRLPAPS